MDINIGPDAVITDDACHVSHGGIDWMEHSGHSGHSGQPLFTRVVLFSFILVRDRFIALALYGLRSRMDMGLSRAGSASSARQLEAVAVLPKREGAASCSVLAGLVFIVNTTPSQLPSVRLVARVPLTQEHLRVRPLAHDHVACLDNNYSIKYPPSPRALPCRPQATATTPRPTDLAAVLLAAPNHRRLPGPY
jgi:hypothetical protein